ncbi:hypothetical protein U1Q18_010237 [Sarracenia purpurea var. burkii]
MWWLGIATNEKCRLRRSAVVAELGITDRRGRDLARVADLIAVGVIFSDGRGDDEAGLDGGDVTREEELLGFCGGRGQRGPARRWRYRQSDVADDEEFEGVGDHVPDGEGVAGGGEINGV